MRNLRMLLAFSLALMVFALPCPRSSWSADASGEAAELRRKVEDLERRLEVERLRVRRLELEKQVAAERARADAAEQSAAAKPLTGPTYTNSIGMEFVLIPAGRFPMGCSSEAEKCERDEKPRHEVTISQPFYLGKFEVTQAQWEAVMGSNPSHFQGPDRPVDRVSWEYAQEFIRMLNEKENTTRYRLPTEAEWEYAARAGSKTTYSFGDEEGRLGGYAWYEDNSGDETHPVGQKRANAWGLHDMHGNVWEWVQDWYGKKYYSAEAVTDPQGPGAGKARVLRGGSWYYPARFCRSARRAGVKPDLRVPSLGFRLALSPGH